ncbi:MAG: hypothetical protein RXR30_04755 [Nitrososphaeria archaeon]
MISSKLKESVIRAEYIEQVALNSLLEFYRITNREGRDYLEVEIFETMIHREIMKAIRRAEDELEEIRKLPEGNLSFRDLIESLKARSDIEKTAEIFYQEQSSAAPTPFLRGLFELIAQNEKLHSDTLNYALTARNSIAELSKGSSCLIEGSPGSNFLRILELITKDLKRKMFMVKTREDLPSVSDNEILIIPSYFIDRDNAKNRRDAVALATRLAVEVSEKVEDGSMVVFYYANELCPSHEELVYDFWDSLINTLRRNFKDLYVVFVCTTMPDGSGCVRVYPLVDYVVDVQDVYGLMYRVKKVSP